MKAKRIWWGVTVGVLCALSAPALGLEGGGNGDEGQPHNGLSSEAFLRNAITTNKEALRLLLDHPLNDALFELEGHKLAAQLADPGAMAIMEELVQCALDRSAQVTARNPASVPIATWRGQMGLCRSWSTSGLRDQQECQELLTACVMARVNALGKSIPLSMRGQPATLFPLRSRVVTETRLRESAAKGDPVHGDPISSFESPCAPGKDCDWRPGYIGRCTGGQLSLQIPGGGGGGSTLRVCAGIHGCTKAQPYSGVPGAGAAPSAAYSGFVRDYSLSTSGQPAGAATVDLQCDPAVGIKGYYSVMMRKGPAQSIDQLLQQIDATQHAGGGGAYPASERETFAFVEGAFYGNLFDPAKLTESCQLVPAGGGTGSGSGSGGKLPQLICTIGQKLVTTCVIDGRDRICPRGLSVPYRDVHACYALGRPSAGADAAIGVAYLNHRICALSEQDGGGKCFPHDPEPCEGGGDALCEWVDDASGYRSCKDPETRSRTFRPVTTYLNEPCDLIGEGGLCNKLRASHWNVGGGSATGGCWGCERLSPMSAAIVAVAVLLLLLWLGRRRRR
jgi:hypothetical protein